MSARQQIEIHLDPANPVNYLACCGIFDLLARIDAFALAHWETRRQIRFVLQTSVWEQDLLRTLVHTLCSPAHWLFTMAKDSEEVTRIEVTFCSPAHPEFSVGLDWWYETLNEDGSVSEKSAWKMYAGQQTVNGIVNDMVDACASFHSRSLTDLLSQSVNMTGRFGFDPRSSRNALDVGYSANDLEMPIPTYAFAELLAVFGAASFFPQRHGPIGRLESTRAWNSEPLSGFAYCLWTDSLPVTLARIAATRSSSPSHVRLFSQRAYRKNYSNLTFAKPVAITGGNP
jgi:hypothetical protein